MLYREIEANLFSAWAGEPIPTVINVPVFEGGEQVGLEAVAIDMSLPLNIEMLWSAEELAAYGLYLPAPAVDLPAGKVSTGQHVARVGGVVRFVDELEDIPPPALSDYQLAIQTLIDSTAQGRNYDSGNSCVSYVGDPNATYDAEAVAFRNWRSSVWTYAYAELAKVQAGTRSQPTVEAFLGELPAIAWP